MGSYLLGFQAPIALVGGKAANLGELERLGGVRVPEGFCVSTEAYEAIVEPVLAPWLGRLAALAAADRAGIAELGRGVRAAIEAIALPAELGAAIAARLEPGAAYAVRSSATAEDLPGASFAGQQDTYLNVPAEQVPAHVTRCWASLFTDRAISYRLQQGFDHRQVRLAVIVQRMVFPEVSGILFTADPVNGNRHVTSIDASFGLGEALVSGLVSADVYKVREGAIVERQLGSKQLAIEPVPGGGTRQRALDAGQQPALTDAQVLALEGLGRTIEAHFGCPQDIEWCLADGAFFVVQSRPITTLYPIPEPRDEGRHVYISVAHQQMMTDALRPLGLSLFQMNAPRPMPRAGGRLFVDVTANLASPSGRQSLLAAMGQHDPLIRDAVGSIVERGFIATVPDEPGKTMHVLPPRQPVEDEDTIVETLIRENEASVDEARRAIQGKQGVELLDFIREDIPRLMKVRSDPRGTAVFMAAIEASFWLNQHVEEWLGEKGVADTLTQSVPHNVTSEMGLALMDVADVIRPYPQVIAHLQHGELEGLEALPGGPETLAALEAFLARYGMRCAGEIDITRTRWGEDPTILFPLILGNLKNFAPGASKQKFEQGEREALAKARELLERLRQLPDGEAKAAETERKIHEVRAFIGFREYPKYGMMSRFYVYKQALMQEAARLVQAGVLRQPDDLFYLTFDELYEVVGARQADHALIERRREEQRRFEKLTPPRVMTSEGEVVAGRYRREDLPEGALVGLPVSAGLVEGRARVVASLEEANLEEGDILVTAFTDPSWTPLFVSLKGLVTEVGGLMTHGAVIAREYGLPAVVGVQGATRLIKDGQRIRVHGTEGYVELVTG